MKAEIKELKGKESTPGENILTMFDERKAAKSGKSYSVGDKVVFKGDDVTITTPAYELHGGMWHDAKTAGGKTVTIPAKGEREKRSQEKKQEWQEQQKQFRNLAKSDAARERALKKQKGSSRPQDVKVPQFESSPGQKEIEVKPDKRTMRLGKMPASIGRRTFIKIVNKFKQDASPETRKQLDSLLSDFKLEYDDIFDPIKPTNKGGSEVFKSLVWNEVDDHDLRWQLKKELGDVFGREHFPIPDSPDAYPKTVKMDEPEPEKKSQGGLFDDDDDLPLFSKAADERRAARKKKDKTGIGDPQGQLFETRRQPTLFSLRWYLDHELYARGHFDESKVKRDDDGQFAEKGKTSDRLTHLKKN